MTAAEKKRHKKEKKRKHKKEKKRHKKKSKREATPSIDDEHNKKKKRKHSKEKTDTAVIDTADKKQAPVTYPVPGDKRIVQTSALDFHSSTDDASQHNVTLLLFYQYVEPPWDSEMYHKVLAYMQHLGDSLKLTGRMRVAKEGLNCTLTSSHESILKYCKALREFHEGEFKDTEFKLTTDLPQPQAFPSLKVMPVSELVHYGLDGEKAPPIEYTGVHLQPADYHEKLADRNTVVIDVRNHYEA